MRNILCLLTIIAVVQACKASPSRPSFGQYQKTLDDNPKNELGGEKETPEGVLILLSDPNEVAFPRLTHVQWEHTVRDLLSLSADPGYSKKFPVDKPTKFGNDGTNLFISGDLWSAYRDAAEDIAQKTGSSSSDYKKLLPSDSASANAIVSAVLKRAYRRPASSKEITEMVAIYNKGSSFFPNIKDQKGANIAALLSAVLQSPFFLYRSELGNAGVDDSAILSEYEVASRLSYAIWNSMPDAELLKTADDKSILKTATRKSQVKRMMSDAKGKSLLRDLHYNAYAIGGLDFSPQDTKKYPELAQVSGDLLMKEAGLFVEEVFVKQKKGIEEFLTAPYAFVSSKSAGIYGAKVSSETAQKTNLDASKYSGIVTQAAFLNHYSRQNDGTTSIIRRGHYVTETILCRDFASAPPPPTLGKNADFKTNREYINNLTKACGGCHTQVINPPGFALESYGPSGKFRTTEDNDATAKIDPAGEFVFADETKIEFKNAVQLLKQLATRDETHQCYAKKLIEGLYAKPTSKDDSELLVTLAEESRDGASGYDLIIKALTSDRVLVRYGK